MGRVEFTAADASAQRAFEGAACLLDILAFHERGHLGIVSQGKNCLPVGLTVRRVMAVGALRDGPGVGAKSILGAMLLDHAEPGLLHELKEPGCARSA